MPPEIYPQPAQIEECLLIKFILLPGVNQYCCVQNSVVMIEKNFIPLQALIENFLNNITCVIVFNIRALTGFY